MNAAIAMPLRHRRLLRYSSILAVALLGVYLALLLVIPTGARAPLMDISLPIWNLLAAGGLAAAAWRSARVSRRLGWAWGVLALGQFLYALGDITWMVLELALHQPEFPSLAQFFYGASYPLYLVGIFLLPGQPVTAREWAKNIIDMTFLILSAALVFWNFLLGPQVGALAGEPLTTQLISMAYPVFDLALFGGLLILYYNRYRGQLNMPLLLLSAGILVVIVCDCIYAYQLALGNLNRMLDWAWMLAYVLVGQAGLWQFVLVQHKPEAQPAPDPAEVTWEVAYRPFWFAFLPYLWLAAAFGLLLWSFDHSLSMTSRQIVWMVAGLTALLLVRLMVILLENQRLFQQLNLALERGRQQTRDLSHANESLEGEIQRRQQVEEQLIHDALHDVLTGLPNRALFLDRLRHALDYAQRQASYNFAVLFLDLDLFKVVNDSLGHSAGDWLLQTVAEKLRLCLRASDTVARLGGDEFVILVEEAEARTAAVACADRIKAVLEAPINLEGHSVFISASIGIVLYDQHYRLPEEILRDADLAMYQAKALGKARYEIFDRRLREHAQSRLTSEHELRLAIEQHQFYLVYQPIYAIRSRRLVGFEALLRWRHPQRGLVSPAEFIPIAEEIGLIVPIGQWVLGEACWQMRLWQVQYPQELALTMNVNISVWQLVRPEFIAQVEQALSGSGLASGSLHLEITENVFLSDTAGVLEKFQKLQALGVHIHIDDFGTGYSSLGYLQNLPVQAIKIDRVFIQQMEQNHGEIVHTIIKLAHELDLEVVAEGVETEGQLKVLRSLSCDYAQGYLLDKPLSTEQVEALMVIQANKLARQAGEKTRPVPQR